MDIYAVASVHEALRLIASGRLEALLYSGQEVYPPDRMMCFDGFVFTETYEYVPEEDEVSLEMTKKLHADCCHPDYQYTVIEALTLAPNGVEPRFTMMIDPSMGWEPNDEWPGQRVVEIESGNISYKKEKNAPKNEGKIVTTEHFNEIHMQNRCDDLTGVTSVGILACSIMYSMRIPIRRLRTFIKTGQPTDDTRVLRQAGTINGTRRGSR